MTDSYETNAEKFEKFHVDNPHVYDALCRLAREWVTGTGRRKCGIGSLVEVVRWQIAMRTNDPHFKINNTFNAFYARLLMANEPDLAGIFELRASEADEWMESRAA